MQPRGRGANPIGRRSGLLDVSRLSDLICRQVLERADRFDSNDGRGDRLRSAQRERCDRFAAARSERRRARRILLWRPRRAGSPDLCRAGYRNLSLQFLALRHVGRARLGQNLRAVTRPLAGAPFVRKLMSGQPRAGCMSPRFQRLMADNGADCQSTLQAVADKFTQSARACVQRRSSATKLREPSSWDAWRLTKCGPSYVGRMNSLAITVP